MRVCQKKSVAITELLPLKGTQVHYFDTLTSCQLKIEIPLNCYSRSIKMVPNESLYNGRYFNIKILLTSDLHIYEY